MFGAGEGIRTPDQRLGKPMRYHCATPALFCGVYILGLRVGLVKFVTLGSIW